jgi:hypothetical protein
MFQVNVILTKCPSKAERGMCEDFPPETINDLCEKLPQKDQMWSSFIECMHDFIPQCPVAKVSIYLG